MTKTEATLTFQGPASRRLREGMRIAEAIVRGATPMVGCRLVWPPDKEQPELLATEGARLAQVLLDGATRNGDNGLFDVALPTMNRLEALETVRKNGPDKAEHNHHRVCRMKSSRKGLRIWRTLRRQLREGDGDGATVARGDDNAAEAIVFGMRHPLLVDTPCAQ